MKQVRFSVLAAVVSMVTISAGAPAFALTALYYSDGQIGTDTITPSLTGAGYTITTATSASQFQTLISGGGYDLGAYFNQSGSLNSAAVNALGTFVNNGGKSVFVDWTRDASAAAQFGAGYTGNSNSNSFTITDAAFGSGTYSLTNPGWGTYSNGLTALAGSSVVATFANGDAAIIVGNSGRSLTFGFLNDTAPQLALTSIFQGQEATPVPFEISPTLSLSILGGLYATKKLLSYRKNRKEVNA